MRKQDLKAVDSFPDGFFFMRCKQQEMAVDVNGGGMTVRAPRQHFSPHKRSPPPFIEQHDTSFNWIE